MAYKVIFAPAAIARLEDYVAADDPGTARTFALNLINRAELLGDFQSSGRFIENVSTFDASGAIPISSTID